MNQVLARTELAALTAPPALATVRSIVDGFKEFQVLLAGYGSGLFDWLAEHGPAEKATIGAALNLRGAHLSAFLQTLEDLGLLARAGTIYSLPVGMTEALTTSSPWCQAATLEALLAPSNGWADMQAFMTEGWPPKTWQAPHTLALHPFLGEAQQLAATLAPRRGRGCGSATLKSLLCFDGGDGLLAAALCQRFPELRATVVVAPDAQQRTEQVLLECGVAERCQVLAGTPLDTAINETFDKVVLFHSLYPVRKSMTDALAAAAARVAPGGELCCAHWFCLEACESAPGGLRDLDKAVLTDSHPLCGVEKFCQRLEDAGLVEAERADLVGDYGNTKLHFARRPGGGCGC